MFVAFIIGVSTLFLGFEAGQENPNANSLIDSTAKVFVDDRAYIVDELN